MTSDVFEQQLQKLRQDRLKKDRQGVEAPQKQLIKHNVRPQKLRQDDSGLYSRKFSAIKVLQKITNELPPLHCWASYDN